LQNRRFVKIKKKKMECNRIHTIKDRIKFGVVRWYFLIYETSGSMQKKSDMSHFCSPSAASTSQMKYPWSQPNGPAVTICSHHRVRKLNA
jgi:hypothetical protein